MKEKYVSDIRTFNRFYTSIIGLLDGYILDSRYTLPEVRVLYELYHHEALTASDIIILLGIDKGYLSRILAQFEKRKLIVKKRSVEDARSAYLSLTKTGRNEFETLNEKADEQIKKILAVISEKECRRLIQNMSEIKSILSKASGNKF